AACKDSSARTATGFDGGAAIGYVKTQLDFGPRIPGSEGHRRTGDWIVAEMRRRADTVVVQEWTHTTAAGAKLPLRNVIARFRPDLKDRVLYVTHWDTRPISDEATNPLQRQLPVPGANDGASGVALFLALGDALKKAPPTQFGVDLLFVDGEDYGDFSKDQDVLLGSKYFAEHLPSPDYRPVFGVLWDMIGDRELQIFEEDNSVRAAPEVVARVWQQAADLGYGEYFVPRVQYSLIDDHMPLIKAGLRVIDVIDYDYPHPPREGEARISYHHTPDDRLDKVSAKSLQIVGDVAIQLLR
ncbi:MAG TPA: M28 family peptidase, partial [Gaiellaceae bacterium]|nr:M28 family peptidase [Gaiellaceae bacterium]